MAVTFLDLNILVELSHKKWVCYSWLYWANNLAYFRLSQEWIFRSKSSYYGTQSP